VGHPPSAMWGGSNVGDSPGRIECLISASLATLPERNHSFTAGLGL
jgi:hypothetical protein